MARLSEPVIRVSKKRFRVLKASDACQLHSQMKIFNESPVGKNLNEKSIPKLNSLKFTSNSIIAAYKHADGKKIDGKRVLVDVERGRTVKGWLPRRLGGGLGGTRRGGPDVNVKISGREDQDRERFRDDGKRDRHEDRRDRRADRRERDRSTDREERRRDRSRDKHREKDRKRSKDRDKDKSDRKRSRSRNRKDKDKSERKRSRERDKDRDKDKKRRREEREKERKDKDKIKPEPDADTIKIKEEPIDDYPAYDDNYDYSNSNHIKSEF